MVKWNFFMELPPEKRPEIPYGICRGPRGWRLAVIILQSVLVMMDGSRRLRQARQSGRPPCPSETTKKLSPPSRRLQGTFACPL